MSQTTRYVYVCVRKRIPTYTDGQDREWAVAAQQHGGKGEEHTHVKQLFNNRSCICREEAAAIPQRCAGAARVLAAFNIGLDVCIDGRVIFLLQVLAALVVVSQDGRQRRRLERTGGGGTRRRL